MSRPMNHVEIIEAVDASIDPEFMSPTEALEYLEELSTQIESRLDALREEMQDGE